MDHSSSHARTGHYPGDDFEPDDTPPASASAAVRILAPRGPRPSPAGFTIYAVELAADEDGCEDIVSAQVLSDRLAGVAYATAIGLGYSLSPTGVEIPATHVVVNDHTGRECGRWPILRAA